MKRGTTGTVSRHMPAPPDRIYDLVSDVTRMGEWSPECRRGQWIEGSTGPVAGARFKGTSKRGLVRWSTTPRVVVADPGREFAFVTTHRGHDETRWTYRFAADGEGTMVTETFELLADLPWYLRLAERFLMGIKDRKADLEAGMAETLRRVSASVEAAPPRPGPSLESRGA